MVWHYPKRYHMLPSLVQEIKLLIIVLSKPKLYKWETPIAHLVRREPDFKAWGDSCLYAAGGFCLDLKFWWQLDWPEEIYSKTLKFVRNNKKGELISINLLEYATILITYAACTVAFEEIKNFSPSNTQFCST